MKTGAVPADDGFRLHDHEEVGPPRAETAQRSPEQPIKGVQRWARPLALQYGDLLAQGEHLERGIPTTAQEDPDRGQEGEDELEQRFHPCNMMSGSVGRPPTSGHNLLI